MKTKILAGLTALLILVPSLASAATGSPANFYPSNVMVSGDFQLPASGRIRTLLDPFIKEVESSMESTSASEKALTDIVIGQLKNGKNFSMAFANPESVYLTLPISTDQWNTLVATLTEKEAYNGVDIYTMDSSTVLAHLGEFLLITTSVETAKTAVDLAQGTTTNPLSSDEMYNKVASGFLSPRVFSVTVNVQELINLLKTQMGEGSFLSESETSGFNTILSVIDPIKIEGLSMTENSNSYKFTAHVEADPAKLKEKNMSLNPGGSFTPSLYMKLGSAKPIFYAENYNQKAAYDQSKILSDELLKNLNMGSTEFTDIQKMITDIAAKLNTVLTKESVIAIQYSKNSFVPYITFMANVNDNKTAAQSLSDDFATTLNADFITQQKNGGFTKFTLDLKKMPDYKGPDTDPITFVSGVTSDGLLIFSNFPNIEQSSTRVGIAADADFAPFAATLKTPLTQAVYFNARNLWGYMDTLFAWIDRSADPAQSVSLDTYKGYYSLLSATYGFKDVSFVGAGTDSSAVLTGTINLDDKTHTTFAQFISGLKGKDTDGDGINDFDERYLYFTPVTKADSDGDGTNDYDELRNGLNPNGTGSLFGDVVKDQYYTDEVGFLTTRHAIAGYPDNTFKPGKLINRAEFTAIVMKAFKDSAVDSSSYFFESGDTQNPFLDLSKSEWYYEPVLKAYRMGLVSGSSNASGDRVFRPADTITRAEAIAILNRASKALTNTSWSNYCPYTDSEPGPFGDVSPNDWFCNAVNNAKVNGLTTGKTEGLFKPFDPMSRAESAVMIQRALEKDTDYSAKNSVPTSFSPFSF